MRTDDDGASRLQRDENLVDGGRRRIGRRHDRGDNAEGLGDLDDLPILQPLQHADRLHRPDESVHSLGCELILLDFVRNDAVSGFLHRELREQFALGRHSGRHRIDNRVDVLLRKLRDLHLRLPGPARERARLRHRSEIAIGCFGRRNRLRTRHVPRLLGLGQNLFDFGVRPRNDVH